MIAECVVAKLTGRRLFSRGIHPPGFKSPSRNCPIVAVPWPGEVVIPLQQHIGVPAQLKVKSRDEVKRGDVIGAAGGFVSAAVHSSVDGTVGASTTCLVSTGRRVPAVPIKAGELCEEDRRAHLGAYLAPNGQARAVDQIDPDEIIGAARTAGLVGMGGATFPTHVKLKIGPERNIDTVVVNGCECEPFLTADERLMCEAPELIVRGLLLIMRATGAKNGLIAIEDNKPEAIEIMRKAVEGHDDIEVVVCMARYPMGGERQLLPAVLNRVVPTGGLPLDVGAVVSNVATAVSLAHATDRGWPLTDRVMTVTGAVNRPGNFFVPIGSPLSWVVEQAEGLREDAAEVIMGGPMMGVTMPDLSVPVTKGTSGIVVLSERELDRRRETACVKCSRCVDHCPLHLTPTKIAHAVKLGDIDLAREYDVTACCECGCCGYVCPARIPLVQYIKSGKAEVMRRQAAAKAKAAK